MPLYQIGGRLCTISGGLGSGSLTGGGGGGTPNPDNTMALTNVSGSTVTDYPLRFARVFMQGEIADASQFLLDGVAATTQVDVKTRWPDTSVKHAIISGVVSSLTNNVAKELTFQNQAASNTALTKSEMLDARFDFDAVISYTVGGVAHTASARAMLTADKYTVWCAGQVATTIILCDHSASAAYDLIWSDTVPLRPIFIATFWNALNKVEIAAIGEQVNAEKLGDISGNLSITKGSASPTSVYTRTGLTTFLGTRWIKRFWIGTAPTTSVNLNHNLSYLKETRAFANFDTTLVPPEQTLVDRYAEWTGASTDLNDFGLWQPYMGNTGGRMEIGPVPTQVSLWLYTGDHRMRDLCLGQADLACAWPIQFRESITTKRLNRADTVNSGTGFGLPISITDRKTTSIINGNYDYGSTVTGDKLKVVGTNGDSGWYPDTAHQPDPFSTQYALTGDPFYLEQMQMWAATTAHYTNGAATGVFYGRGPTGAEGGIHSETRGFAWGLRGRVLASYWSPDTDPMKAYFATLIDDACAIFEGKWGVTTGTFNGGTLWTWEHSLTPFPDTNPLHFVEKNSDMRPVVSSSIGGGQSPWMFHYNVYSFGRAVEMGFTSASAMFQWLCECVIAKINDSGHPYLIAQYQQPTGPAPLDAGAFYSLWSDVYNGSLSQDQTRTDFSGINASNIDHAYEYIATMAAAIAEQFTGGSTAWAWAKTNGYDVFSDKNTCPKWAILPRA